MLGAPVKRIVGEPDIGGGIENFHDLAIVDGVGRPEGLLTRGLCGFDAVSLAFEPLAVFIDQAHDGNGRFADDCGDARQIVEEPVRWGIEDAVALQVLQALRFPAA